MSPATAGRLRRASKALAIVKAALMLTFVMGVRSAAVAQPVELRSIRQVSFTGDGPVTTELIAALRKETGLVRVA